MAIFTKQHVDKIAKALASDANLSQATVSLIAQMFQEDNSQFNSYVFEKRIKILQRGDE